MMAASATQVTLPIRGNNQNDAGLANMTVANQQQPYGRTTTIAAKRMASSIQDGAETKRPRVAIWCVDPSGAIHPTMSATAGGNHLSCQTAAAVVVPTEWPPTIFDKMAPKQSHDALWQEALTKYKYAQSLLAQGQTSAEQLNVEQDDDTDDVDGGGDDRSGGDGAPRDGAGGKGKSLYGVLCTFVLPSIPPKMEPPKVNANDDMADTFQRVGDYALALVQRNKVLKEYNESMDQWSKRLNGVVQKCTAQATRRQQRRNALPEARATVEALQKALAAATVAMEQAKVKEVEATQANQQAVEEVLQCFSA
jgi:hypothetical protein